MTTKRKEYVNGKLKSMEYESRDPKCGERWCFVPFNGNGQRTCRRYEVGTCTDGADSPAGVKLAREEPDDE